MKKLRSHLKNRSRFMKQACTVSAAALMLGVSHAAVVGLNFQVSWDDAGSAGYTGFPVTATAFGIPPNSWENLTPVPTGYSGSDPGPFFLMETIDTSSNMDGLNPLPSGNLSISWQANAANTSGFGINDPAPYGGNQPHRGEQEVYYGFLRDNLFIYTSPTSVIDDQVTISGLRSLFTNAQHAYVVRTVAATDSGKVFTNVVVSSLTTTDVLSYSAVFTNFYNTGNTARNVGIMGGVSSSSGALTDDAITIAPSPAYDGPNGKNNYNTGAGTDDGPAAAGTLSAVLLADKPIIVSQPSGPADLCSANSAILTVDAMGVPPLTYQWRKSGVPIAGATSPTYAVPDFTRGNVGFYDVVINNAYGTITSDPVAIGGPGTLLIRTQANVLHDTKPVGPEQNALDNGATWVASSSDGTKTRAGVLRFNGTNDDQVTLPGGLQATNGTISFWMRSAGTLTSSPEESPGAMIFTGGDINDTGNDGLSIVQDDSGVIATGTLGVTTRGTYSFGVSSIEGGVGVADNNWHLVTVTYDQSTNSGGIGLFIDGALDTTNSNGGGWGWPALSAQKIALGLSHKTNWRPYNGDIDDFRIYDRVLNNAQIAQIYASDAIVDSNALQLRLNFDAAPANGYALEWGCGTSLQASAVAKGPYTPISTATSPWIITSSQLQQFYRLEP